MRKEKKVYLDVFFHFSKYIQFEDDDEIENNPVKTVSRDVFLEDGIYTCRLVVIPDSFSWHFFASLISRKSPL